MEVVVESPEEMNLLGLFMKAAFDARLGALEKSGASGDIGLTAGRMSVTLSFGDGRVLIRKGIVGAPKAHIKGSLESLIAIARGKIAPTILRGRARVTGNPLAALPLARVFKSGPVPTGG